MKVLLINAPFTPGIKQKFGTPPLGILYIASFLLKNKVDIDVLDSNAEGLTIDEIKKYVIKKSPDIVGISSMTAQIHHTLKIIQELKKENKKIKICLGGSHVNSVKDEVFKFSSDIDYLIYGEGEHTFLDLIRNIDHPERVDGLIYKDQKNNIQINKPRKYLETLDELPFPNINLIDINKYEVAYASNSPAMSMICSRGCPYTCTFCDAYNSMGRIHRLRSPKNIVDEMEYLKDRGIKHIVIKDSTFTIDKQWVLQICDEIVKRELNITWNCNSRVNTITIEILSEMKKAGCTMIGFGVESGSEEILKNLRKFTTINQIKNAFKITREVGIETYGFFMIGNPGDNPANVRKTIDLAKELDPDLVAFTITTPYPGTDLYNWALENGALSEKYWYMKNIDDFLGVVLTGAIMNLPELSSKEVAHFLKKAYREFFLRPTYLLKSIKRLSNPRQAKIMINALFEIVLRS